MNSLKRFEYACKFTKTLLDLFDYWDPSIDNNFVRTNLSKLGAGHTCHFWLIMADDKPHAIVYRLSSYYASNVTGIVNSIFVLLASDFAAEDFHDLTRTVSNPDIAGLGAEDILFIGSSKKINELRAHSDMSESMDFNFVALDLLHVSKDFGLTKKNKQ